MPQTQDLPANWQQQLSTAYTSIDDLCEYLQLSSSQLEISPDAAKNFPLKVTSQFASCMEKGNPNDPLLRQVLPVTGEIQFYPGFSHDPVGDLNAAVHAGVLHKYHGRALLIATGACAINCRYCFRRNFPYTELQLSKQHEHAALTYLQENTSITEVILSGGDPLLLNDARLIRLIGQINNIPHLKRIRIHSRLPIVLPARITDELLHTLGTSPKQTVMVVHCNHAHELNRHVAAACKQLRAHGITLLNQSVLLKGVNDSVDALWALSEKLFSIGILPYYLHTLDKATGTGHFEVPKSEALALMEQVQALLPGYLVPKLVVENAGAKSKQYVY